MGRSLTRYLCSSAGLQGGSVSTGLYFHFFFFCGQAPPNPTKRGERAGPISPHRGTERTRGQRRPTRHGARFRCRRQSRHRPGPPAWPQPEAGALGPRQCKRGAAKGRRRAPTCRTKRRRPACQPAGWRGPLGRRAHAVKSQLNRQLINWRG